MSKKNKKSHKKVEKECYWICSCEDYPEPINKELENKICKNCCNYKKVICSIL
jgi:hypothetical protein